MALFQDGFVSGVAARQSVPYVSRVALTVVTAILIHARGVNVARPRIRLALIHICIVSLKLTS